jgi:hypothetical protein
MECAVPRRAGYIGLKSIIVYASMLMRLFCIRQLYACLRCFFFLRRFGAEDEHSQRAVLGQRFDAYSIRSKFWNTRSL